MNILGLIVILLFDHIQGQDNSKSCGTPYQEMCRNITNTNQTYQYIGNLVAHVPLHLQIEQLLPGHPLRIKITDSKNKVVELEAAVNDGEITISFRNVIPEDTISTSKKQLSELTPMLAKMDLTLMQNDCTFKAILTSTPDGESTPSCPPILLTVETEYTASNQVAIEIYGNGVPVCLTPPVTGCLLPLNGTIGDLKTTNDVMTNIVKNVGENVTFQCRGAGPFFPTVNEYTGTMVFNLTCGADGKFHNCGHCLDACSLSTAFMIGMGLDIERNSEDGDFYIAKDTSSRFSKRSVYCRNGTWVKNSFEEGSCSSHQTIDCKNMDTIKHCETNTTCDSHVPFGTFDF